MRNYGDAKYGDFAGQYDLTVSNLLIGLRNLGCTQHNPIPKGEGGGGEMDRNHGSEKQAPSL